MDNINLTEVAATRNQMHLFAMEAIYDAYMQLESGFPVNVEAIVSSLMDLPYEDCDYFVKAAVIFTLKYHDDIVSSFNEYLKGWTFQRRNKVEQAIFSLAYVHYYYIEPDVDKAIVINIALQLAKKYAISKDKDAKLINAVLDKVLHR